MVATNSKMDSDIKVKQFLRNRYNQRINFSPFGHYSNTTSKNKTPEYERPSDYVQIRLEYLNKKICDAIACLSFRTW